MHCLEGLLSGGCIQRTERECIYIHLHRRLLERSEFRAVWNQDADSIQTSVEIDAHAVLIKLPRCELRPSPCRGSKGRTRIALAGKLAAAELFPTTINALGTAHAFAHVTAKNGNLESAAPNSGASCTAAAVASLNLDPKPLLRDQCLAVQFGPLRQNVRAIPRAVLAWLAAHGFQPDLVCKSHWTAGKVGVRAELVLGTTKCLHETWNGRFSSASRSPWSLRRAKWPLKSEMVAQKSEMVAQKSEMAVRADRLADGYKSLIPKRLDCVP